MMKIMIAGGGGFVGSYLQNCCLSCDNEVVLLGSNACRAHTDPGYILCDIRDAAAVQTACRRFQPDAFINLAAISNIDAAERDKATAYAINTIGAKHCAEAAAAAGAYHVFVSSDAVFSGFHASYCEEDSPSPCNYYGETKAEAERLVSAVAPDSAILRISLVLGRGSMKGGVVDSLGRRLASGERMKGAIDQFRTPVYAGTLAKAICELIDIRFSGVLHIAATEAGSRFEILTRLAQLLGYSCDAILPASADELFTGLAPRHKNGVLSTVKAQAILKKTPLPNLEETLKLAISSRI